MGSQLKLGAVLPNRERSCSSGFRGDESPHACAGGVFFFTHNCCFIYLIFFLVLNQRVGTSCLGKNSDWRGQKQREL